MRLPQLLQKHPPAPLHRPPGQSPELDAVVEDELALVPEEVFELPSMLSNEERVLLHWAARTQVADGAIVDAGCFLGGSTVSLALGARQSGRPAIIHSFDLFQVWHERERVYFGEDFPFAVGASTCDVYEANIAEVRDSVVVHRGDINALSGWSDAVSVLFIDIAKSWETNDSVVSNFFPRLEPGSLVIHQDLVHSAQPWCALTMELLSDHFRFLGHMWSSAVYETVSPIPAGELPLKMRERVPADDASKLIERTARRVGEPYAGYMRLAQAILLADYGEFRRATQIVRDVTRHYSDATLPWVSEQAEMTRAIIAEQRGRRSRRASRALRRLVGG